MSGGIFVNYRRGDDPGYTGRLFDQLTTAFPRDKLFMDVDGIAPGADFTEVLKQEVDKCDVLLAVVGRNWLEATDAAGQRRLDDPDDFVRIEIAAALAAGKLVVPVLVNGAEMPPGAALPSDIKAFSVRNAVRLTHERFHADLQGLIKSLSMAVADADAKRVADAKRQADEVTAAKRRSDEEAAAQRSALERERSAAAIKAAASSPMKQVQTLPSLPEPAIAGDSAGVPRQYLFVAVGALVIVSAVVFIGIASKHASLPPQNTPQPVESDSDSNRDAAFPQSNCDTGNQAQTIYCQIQDDAAKQDAIRAKIKRDLDSKLFEMRKQITK